MKTDLDRAQLSAYARFAKPILDRIGGLVLTVLTLPLVLVLITMSWVAFGWAPVERVARMGRNGRRFNLYRVNTRKDHQTDLRGRQLRLSRWLRSTSLEGGVNLIGCQMTIDLFGYAREDFIPEVKDFVGAASFLPMARDADVSLFI